MNSLTPLLKGAAGAALLVLVMTGCASTEPNHHRAVAFPTSSGPPPPDYVDTEFPVPDDYMYYPAYQVYYSNYRREYVYLEHGMWVSRPKPPRLVKEKALSSSPSVRVGFKDSPSLHHAEVAEQYPKHWVPADGTKEVRVEGKDDNGRVEK